MNYSFIYSSIEDDGIFYNVNFSDLAVQATYVMHLKKFDMTVTQMSQWKLGKNYVNESARNVNGKQKSEKCSIYDVIVAIGYFKMKIEKK